MGVLLSALFQRYVPKEAVTMLFGGNEAWGVLMAATIGVPLYVCGGGTIPILKLWLADGMSLGSAAAFMLIGSATKITNLGALKTVLGIKNSQAIEVGGFFYINWYQGFHGETYAKALRDLMKEAGMNSVSLERIE